jgi:hypothetical protein
MVGATIGGIGWHRVASGGIGWHRIGDRGSGHQRTTSASASGPPADHQRITSGSASGAPADHQRITSGSGSGSGPSGASGSGIGSPAEADLRAPADRAPAGASGSPAEAEAEADLRIGDHQRITSGSPADHQRITSGRIKKAATSRLVGWVGGIARILLDKPRFMWYTCTMGR